ncbi:MAG: phosphate ABC transporter permease subunit PstC [Aigarchaeota archaeon]|nr:phosphate ABC transporter permease subunit PstC [Aigarchaeota archaeon]MCX8192333.1 phosphate ABC transporter permease subunit PstC [Nitrososphaeria archaeon]MDW7986857.1 phosphate ABC transporter permease subunit PstC [Nitrososphaerota archaeon]
MTQVVTVDARVEALIRHIEKRRRINKFFYFLFFSATLVSTISLIVIFVTLSYESLNFFTQVSIIEFLTHTKWTALFAEKHFGVLPLLNATLITSLIAILVAAPLGVMIALFLSEYASPNLRSIVKPMVETLAGIPTVVYGYFALYFITPRILRGVWEGLQIHNALAVGLMIGVLIIPIVASISDDAMKAVPLDLRHAAYALGARKCDVALRVVLPAALSGVSASIILAFARAMGETMIAAIAGGFRSVLTFNVGEAMETMTAYIAQVATGDAPHGTIEFQSLFAVALFLLLITAALNYVGIKVVRKWAIRY